MSRGKIIVVEGPSNSGKTTTCQNMKNYFKLLDLLFSVSDCVAFEVEAYENIYFKKEIFLKLKEFLQALMAEKL